MKTDVKITYLNGEVETFAVSMAASAVLEKFEGARGPVKLGKRAINPSAITRVEATDLGD